MFCTDINQMATFHYHLDKIVIGLSHQLVCALNEKHEAWKRVQALQVLNSTAPKKEDDLTQKLETALHNLQLERAQKKIIKAESRETRQVLNAIASAAALRLSAKSQDSNLAEEILLLLHGRPKDTITRCVESSKARLEAHSLPSPFPSEATTTLTDSSYEVCIC